MLGEKLRVIPRFLARETEMSGVLNQDSKIKQQWLGGEDKDFRLGQAELEVWGWGLPRGDRPRKEPEAQAEAGVGEGGGSCRLQ